MNIYDFIIIGAGPAGLQWGLFLQSFKKEFVILEKGSHPAMFFDMYPRSRKLISHNRCNLSPTSSREFRLRHDWHSLLDAPMTFCDLKIKDFYPHADDYVQYMKNISTSLNVLYNWNARHVEYHPDYAVVCEEETDRGASCLRAKHIVLATGMTVRPTHFKYDYSNFPDLDPNTNTAPFCLGKRIGIVGGGNAAYETANMLATCAESVHIFTPRPTLFASLTHYPGNVRLQYAAHFDRYMLKTLDTIEVIQDSFRKTGCFDTKDCSGDSAYIDVFIYCGGFTSNQTGLIEFSNATQRFPESQEFYTVPHSHGRGMYSGVVMHGRDYKKSAGGFVHGFRYLIRAQVRYMMLRESNVWPGEQMLSLNSSYEMALHRAQHSSGLYQMQDVLRDMYIRINATHVLFLPEVPGVWMTTVSKIKTLDDKKICDFRFAYDTTHGVFDFERAMADEYAGKQPPLFLHPVIRLYDGTVWHVNEDLYGRWKLPHLVEEIQSVMHTCLTATL